jgi:tetratricopeptide (TPR) repeat protein
MLLLSIDTILYMILDKNCLQQPVTGNAFEHKGVDMKKIRLAGWLLIGLAAFSSCSMLRFTRHDEVANQKKKIAELKHQLGLSHFLDGVYHELFNEYGEAIAEYEKTLQFDSTSTAVYNALADNYFLLGRHDEAITAIKRALVIDPLNKDNYYNLANLFEYTNKTSELPSVYRKLIELEPSA